MLSETDLTTQIQALLSQEMLLEIESPETDLLKTGLLDSLTLVQLLLRLEERFRIKLTLEELEIEDFRSVRSIARLVACQCVAARAL